MNEPKGWRPDHTYTGRGRKDPEKRWDNRPSQNPYPKNMPNVGHPVTEILQIVKAERQYEKMLHAETILFDGGQHDLLRSIVMNIRRYKAIKEEMTTGVYVLPKDLLWYLSLDTGEEEYAK